MQFYGKLKPVSFLYAEPDQAMRRNLSLYLENDPSLNLCATAESGQEVVAALKEGLVPDVLVLDGMIQHKSLFCLLEEIAGTRFKMRPAIVVTLAAANDALKDKLLTFGVDFIILKPYDLKELCHTVLYVGTQGDDVAERKQEECIRWCLDGLQADYSDKGSWYILQAEKFIVRQQKSCSINEVYQSVGEAENVSIEAVSAAIRRTIARMQRFGTPTYRQLCGYLGAEDDKVLPNAEFLMNLGQMIRRSIDA